LQNRLPGGLSRPQAGQRCSSRVPQALQNIASCGLSCRHCEHLMRNFLDLPSGV
jgi:hypothetical protein